MKIEDIIKEAFPEYEQPRVIKMRHHSMVCACKDPINPHHIPMRKYRSSDGSIAIMGDCKYCLSVYVKE